MIELLKRAWSWLREQEPAELNALKVTVFGWLATFGVTIGSDVKAEIGFWVGVAVVVLTQVQAVLTRYGVFSPSTVRKLTTSTSES